MQYKFKLVIVGYGGSGKSSLVIRYLSSHFVDFYDPTLEDSYIKNIQMGDDHIHLTIFDTAGQDEFSSVTDQYLSIGHGFIVSYSIDSTASFDEVEKYRLKLLSVGSSVPVVLVGNKSDLESEREVLTSVGQAYALSHQWKHFETSSKLGTNVDTVFLTVVQDMIISTPQEQESQRKRKSGCTVL
eukprot:TRINITY_DN7713_c0_g1_i1.p1 TRINITY_DN7713_c0_g1~~TRINITY_DN7713_c0_g1_i1.p1  ORF type:complete len:185 (-),score=41.51 TRINITY_DN7713_c0_g1_i1:29-583(-)